LVLKVKNKIRAPQLVSIGKKTARKAVLEGVAGKRPEECPMLVLSFATSAGLQLVKSALVVLAEVREIEAEYQPNVIIITTSEKVSEPVKVQFRSFLRV